MPQLAGSAWQSDESIAFRQVLVVDDHLLIHHVMRAVLQRALNPESIFVGGDLQQALDCAQTLKELDLVVLDLSLPGCHGISAVTDFRERFSRPRIVVLSDTNERETVIAAMDAGASAYMTKRMSIPVMEAVLRLIAAGGKYAPPESLRSNTVVCAKSLSTLGLTHREVEVLRLLVRGVTNKTIANALNISLSTVKQHARSVFNALGVSTRVEVIIAASRLGLILD